MATTLILIGVLCVIAAIVGGGVKLSTLEVGTVASVRRQLLLGGFGALLCLSGVAAKQPGRTSDLGPEANTTATNATANEAASSNTNTATSANTAKGSGNATANETDAERAPEGIHDVNNTQPSAGAKVTAEKASTSADRREPTSRSDDGPPSSTTVQDRPVMVDNECPVDITVSMAVFDGSKWTSYGQAQWTIPPKEPGRLRDSSKNVVMASSREFFWKVVRSERINPQGGNQSKAGLDGVRRALFDINNDGDYVFSVSC